MDLPAPAFYSRKKGGDVRSRLHARTLHICNIRGLPVQWSAGLHFQPGRENFPRGVENEAIRVALAESDDIGPLFVGADARQVGESSALHDPDDVPGRQIA